MISLVLMMKEGGGRGGFVYEVSDKVSLGLVLCSGGPRLTSGWRLGVRTHDFVT